MFSIASSLTNLRILIPYIISIFKTKHLVAPRGAPTVLNDPEVGVFAVLIGLGAIAHRENSVVQLRPVMNR